MRHLEDYADNRAIIIAGIAALYKVSSVTAEADLRRLRFPDQMITLAALQHVTPGQLNLLGLPVNIHTADPETIKASILLVGFDRAPSNLFDAKYNNAEIIKVLSGHDNALVAQYSVWAVTENPSLKFNDIGIKLSDVRSRPTNVRAWIYRLISKSPEICLNNLDFIREASGDEQTEARLGLAHGMRETFSCELVPVMLDWITREMDDDVRQRLLDHVVFHANASHEYREHAIDAYRWGNKADRERMRAAAAQTALYSEFRKIDFQEEGDLFVPTINFNNNQIGQIGAVGGAGRITNSDGVILSPDIAHLVRVDLGRANDAIQSMQISEADRQELVSVIAAANSNLNYSNVRHVLDKLTRVAGVITAVAGVDNSLTQIVQSITKILGFNN